MSGVAETAEPPAQRRTPRQSVDDPLLVTYLNAHLAAATTLIAELRRAGAAADLAASRSTLRALRRDVVADRASLRAVMRDIGIATDWAVLGMSWLTGNAALLRPVLNRLPLPEGLPVLPALDRGPVQALVELEGLAARAGRRAAVWRVLGAVAVRDGRLRPAAFEELSARAADQTRLLEAVAQDYAATVFGAARADPE